MILPYDPFGKNRMVYTVKNSCVEDSDVAYNDGATKIFLYTKGTEGNPSQALKNMLKYIQESTKENAASEEIVKVEGFVDKVKHRKEVGVNYMKSWEVVEMAKQEGSFEMQERINQLIICLMEAERTDDIMKAARDRAYQEELFKEFNL